MVHPKTRVILAMMLIATSALTRCVEAATGIGVLREASCPFRVPEGLVLGQNFKFGYVTVPERHAHPAGKTIELAVAIFPSSNENHAPDPIVLNTGGPGGSNMDDFVPAIASDLGHLLLSDRDVVIIELRGLRYSKPNLICKELSEASTALMKQDLSYDQTRTIILKALKASHDRFVREGVNLSAFNNVETAADIDLTMTRLGYDTFNLFGSSAGTLVAQHLIRDYPERVRSVVLNAALPMNSTVLRDMVPNGIATLKRIFAKCNDDRDCQLEYGNIEEQFLSLLDSLEKNPVTIPLKHPKTGEAINYVLNGYRFGAYVFIRMYSTPQIPFLIKRVMGGDYTDVKAHVITMLGMSDFAHGLGHTVFLSEACDFKLSDIKIDPAYSIFAQGATASGLGGEFELSVKQIWSIPPLDPERIALPESSKVPVLVMNGLYDHVIPAKYDRVMRQSSDNCYLFRFDGISHSVVDSAPECALPMALAFLKDPSQAPDSSGLQNYKLRLIAKANSND